MSMTDSNAGSAAAEPIAIIPRPEHMIRLPGVFCLTPSTVIDADPAAGSEAALLAEALTGAAGFVIAVRPPAPGERPLVLAIDLTLTDREGYTLSVSPDSVEIRARDTAGLFYGAQTLLQLLPPSVFSGVSSGANLLCVPCIEIEDRPRFGWRGVMLDVSRHFMPLAFLHRFVDLLAMHKLNVLHLHLNDDQGWRLEIKKYPKLTGVGAYRKETMAGRLTEDSSSETFDLSKTAFDHCPHGGFYTQDEARALVAYAAAHHVTIVPEIEMPGHARAAIAAYPELGCTEQPVDVTGIWGIHPDLFNADESTLQFLQDVLVEVMEIFPSPYIHIGGDEAIKTQWKESSRIQARIRELGLKDEEELQSYFIRRMDEFLTASGRRLIGWDEIMEGGLAPNAVVMSWRGESGGIAAAADGHDVVMAPYQSTYFDYYQSSDWHDEPLAFAETLTLPSVYAYQPAPAQMPPACAGHILGAQAQLWTEYVPEPAQVEYQVFPRACALAEVVWTTDRTKDYDEFIQRLSIHLERLTALGVNYRPLDTIPSAPATAGLPEIHTDVNRVNRT